MSCRQGQATRRKRFKFVTLNIYCFYTFKIFVNAKEEMRQKLQTTAHRNSVKRFKRVENQSHNHALLKRTRQCRHEKGNAFVL